MRKKKWKLLDLADLAEPCTKIRVVDSKTKILEYEGEIEDAPYECLRCVIKNWGIEDGTVKVRVRY